jgi:hypothetical protein
MSVKRNIFIVLFIFLITISVKAENHIKKIRNRKPYIRRSYRRYQKI